MTPAMMVSAGLPPKRVARPTTLVSVGTPHKTGKQEPKTRVSVDGTTPQKQAKQPPKGGSDSDDAGFRRSPPLGRTRMRANRVGASAVLVGSSCARVHKADDGPIEVKGVPVAAAAGASGTAGRAEKGKSAPSHLEFGGIGKPLCRVWKTGLVPEERCAKQAPKTVGCDQGGPHQTR